METVNQNTSNQVQVTFGPISIDKVEVNPYKDNRFQAQVRQTVTKHYPGGRPNDSLSDALFNAEEFNFEPTSYDEIRVAWIDVPLNSTLEQVQAKLREFPNAKIKKFLSLHPILTDEQKAAMESGLTDKTVEDFAEKQMIINPDLNAPAFYKGHPQYSVKKFVTTAQPDVDTREADLEALGGSLENEVQFVGAAPATQNQPA